MGISKVSAVPFTGTKEQEKKLLEVIKTHKEMQGALMPVLQKAQELYGYLPSEIQQIIAEGLGLSMEDVYGVVTFYSQFSLNPKGKYKVGVCLGTACYVKGSGDVFDKFKDILKIEGGCCTADGKFSLDATRCIGCCGLAPVLTVNDEVYGKVEAKDVAGIVEKYN